MELVSLKNMCVRLRRVQKTAKNAYTDLHIPLPSAATEADTKAPGETVDTYL